MPSDLDEFFDAYVECALWSSHDEDNECPMDEHYSADDIHPDALARMRADCESFLTQGAADVAEWVGEGSTPYARAGFLFWLNRNGHGSGFWDEDGYEEGARTRLSDLSHTFGECDLYVGDDGKLYVYPTTCR